MTVVLSKFNEKHNNTEKTLEMCRWVFVDLGFLLCYYFLAERVSAGGGKVKQISDKRLIFLDPSEIIPPKSGRSDNDRYRLFLLSESIRENGLLVPVTVCQTADGYEVISGERRIKASIIAGFKRIPCIVTGINCDPELFRAAECLLGHHRDALEEAYMLKELCLKHSCSSVASALSFTTGELCKIIEVTSLPAGIIEKAKEQHLSLFQLTELCRRSEEERDEYFEELKGKEPVKSVKERYVEKRLPPIKDARFLINSVKQLTESVGNAGIPVNFRQKETEKTVEIRIRIEKNSINSQMSLLHL